MDVECYKVQNLRSCVSSTPAGSVSWFIELCEGGGGDNRRYRMRKKKFQKGRGRSGSQSGPCRFTYFNGSSCTSGPREIRLPFFVLILLLFFLLCDLT